MSNTVFTFSISGLSGPTLQARLESMDKQVATAVSKLASASKANECKWTDRDFGPNDDDEYGEESLYGLNRKPPGGQYPKASKIKWSRPIYADGEEGGEEESSSEEEDDDEEDDEFGEDFDDDQGESSGSWCTKGRLFIGGSGSGDIVQGSLGDCWFLGALSVLATRQELLEGVFFNGEKHKDVGIFTCRFFKDNTWVYVVVDDRIPCYDNNEGTPVFARCRDNDELWVPLIEKAYAKLHGSYKALIGGYVHYGLSDMTGFNPIQMVVKRGHQGFHEEWDKDLLWDRLYTYKRWGSLMGCSIQQPPGEAKKSHEAEGNSGLRLMHAYGFIDLNTINTREGPVRLCRCRNPWGFGEWTGRWGDESEEREMYDKEISSVFSISEAERTEINKMDGTFFMRYEDWYENFTHIFIAVDFPGEWEGKREMGDWDPELGGNRTVKTWPSNPKFKLTLTEDSNVYVGLSIEDSRLTHGIDYYKTPLQSMPMTFDIIQESQISTPFKERDQIPDSEDPDGSTTTQAPYYYQTMQLQTTMKAGEYVIIPSLFKRKIGGRFFVSVYSDKPFTLAPNHTIASETAIKDLPGMPKGMTQQQFNIHVEDVREKLLTEANKLNLSPKQVFDEFVNSSNVKINRKMFKRKLMKLGFNLVDFPDEDFLAIDVDNSGAIDVEEFKGFFNLALSNDSLPSPPPPPPEDDLQFQPTDLDGRLTVSCIEAKGLHPSSTWFDSFKNEDSKTRNKTLVFAPIPQLATLSASSNAMIEEIEVGENTSRRSSVSLQSPLQSPRDGSGSANPLASMATTSIAKRLATKGKQYVEEAADVSDRLHYSEPIKQLEGLRNAFLRRLKTAPRKCSSDTQPKCWDRLPKGVKIEEAYFSEKPPTRKPLALLKQKHKDQDSNITNVTNSPSKALQKAAEKEEAREWIADTLAPQIFEEMIDSVFTIRNFRLGVEKNSNGWDRGGTSVRGGSARSCASTIRGGKAVDEFERKMEEEIENAELIYQRYTPIKILDLDMLSGQKAQKSDAIDLAAAWFRWIDKDDSGKISFREFSDCITEVDLMFSKADTYLLMQRFKIEDEDGADDNMIRYKDFLTWAEGAVKGKITKNEALTSIPTITALIEMVKETALKSTTYTITTLKSDPASLQVVHAMLHDMGCRISLNSVYRLTRCFSEDAAAFNTFINEEIETSKSTGHLDITKLRECLQSVLKRRCEDGTSSSGETLLNSGKIWAQLTNTKSNPVEFDIVRDKFVQLLSETEVEGHPADIFCKDKYNLSLATCTSIVLDNLLTISTKKECEPAFSFSTIDGFIREEEINILERKFYLAIQIHMSKVSGAVNHLVSLYVSKSKETILVKAIDPMSFNTYYMKSYEDTKYLCLPVGEDLFTSCMHPNEEGAFWRFCNRLSLLTVAKRTTLTSSEQKKFVHHLRQLFQEANLPFFVTVNDLCVAFEIDSKTAKKSGSIKKAIFSAIKREKKLHNFLRNTFSSLKVTFSTYDGDACILSDWSEFLAHLNGFRNPYATLELLPKRVPAVKGGRLGEEEGEGERKSNFRAGGCDLEGGSHPKFGENCKFNFSFVPPTLANRPILFTDVCKMMVSEGFIEPQAKLFVLMVRKGEDGSMIITAYDPKSASDWQCKGAPDEWCEDGAADRINLDDAQSTLEEYTTSGKITLGVGITPRVLCKVYNKMPGKGDEFLGTCEVSISGVLSNCGQMQQEWAVLVRGGKVAGHVLLSMQFKRQLDIDMEAAAKAARRERNARLGQERKLKATLKAELGKMAASGGGSPGSAGGSMRGELEIVKRSLGKVMGVNEGLVAEVEQKKGEVERLEQGAEEAEAKRRRVEGELKSATERLSKAEAMVAEGAEKGSGLQRGIIEAEVEKKWKGEVEELQVEVEGLKKELQGAKMKLSETVVVQPEGVEAKEEDVNSPPLPPQPTATAVVAFASVEEARSAIERCLTKRNPKQPRNMVKRLLGGLVDGEGNIDLDDVFECFVNLGLLDLPGFEGKEYIECFDFVMTGIERVGEGHQLHDTVANFGMVMGILGEKVQEKAAASAVAAAAAAEEEEEPLPSGWEKKIRPKDGKVYYVNHNNRSTSWERPTK